MGFKIKIFREIISLSVVVCSFIDSIQVEFNAFHFDPRITSVNVGEFYRIFAFKFSFWALFRYAANEFYLKVCRFF